MGKIFIVLSLIVIVLSSCSHFYYIVRHAEKAAQETNMSSDVPLTEKGKERAEALKEILKDKKIRYVFSTNTIRTKSTAQPTANYFHLTTEIYGPRPDSTFISLLKSRKKNTLIVGHSNTVDDIVNMLCGKTVIAADLPDAEYSKLFIVRFKGKKAFFSEGSIPPKF
jgi:2,3-bisphosphoglycerate-dependent phosphoglycerate mutase